MARDATERTPLAMDTRISLLGPVEVQRDGVVVTTLTGRLAVLLAALAVNGGGTVGYGPLAGYLWGDDDQPEHPRRTLQNYATRLRSLLGDDVIQSSREGFSLGLERATVDVFRFRSLAARPPEGTTPEAELRRLREALSLWRGEPLAGLVPNHLAREHTPGLVDEFLSATERANELRLAMGDLDAELVGSLRQLLGMHPWRERLWAQLMTALYRQGRQGEALTAFHDVVGVLREDLGIDPGADLVQLHERILAGDPTLAAPETVRGTALPKPAQLPPAIPDFVGRDDELPAVTSIARPDADRVTVALVSGGAGVGKTSLAVQAAHAMRARFPDGQLYAGLRGASAPATPADILGAFLRSLGVGDADVPSHPEERSALFRSLCAGQKLLIVLDDAAGDEQVAPLIPGGPGCAVIVTSRARLALAADVRVDLDMFSHDDARALMTNIIGGSRYSAEPAAADRVLSACGGSPLAVRIAASRLATRPSWPIEHLADRLAGTRRLDELWLGDQSVLAMFEAIYGSLGPTLAERFLLLGAIPSNVIDADVAAAAWNVDLPTARASLDTLTDLRLLDFAATPDAHTWHDLVRTFAAQHDAVDRTAARRRLLHYFIQSLLNVKAQFRPGDRASDPFVLATDDIEGQAFSDTSGVHTWLHPRWTTLTALAIQELDGDDERSRAKAAGLAILADIAAADCCGASEIEFVLRAVTRAILPPEADRYVTAAWHNLSSALVDLGRYDDARDAQHEALKRHRARGDRHGEAMLQYKMAHLCHLEGKDADAREHAHEAYELNDALPAPLRAWCLNTVAVMEIELGDLEEAEAHLNEADAIHRTEPVSVAGFRRAMALAALTIRREPEQPVMDAFSDTLAIADQLQAAEFRAETLLLIARSLGFLGEHAVDAAREAVRITHKNHHVRLEAEALGVLATTHELRGDLGAAAEARRQADLVLAPTH